MVLPLLAVVLALLLVGLPLIRLEFPSVLGVVHASGADERILVKLLVAAAKTTKHDVHIHEGICLM